MEKRNGLRRIDWAVMLGCAGMALMTFGAVGEAGRGRAKEAVCQANLHRWGDVFGGIVEENDGRFLSGATVRGYWWPIQLSQELQDWKRNRTWFCPTATVPMVDEKGALSPGSSIFNAWGIYYTTRVIYEGQIFYMTPNGIAGSYSLNGYVIPIPDQIGKTVNTYEGGVPAADGWRNLLDIPEASRVPMFLDAMRFDIWPLHTDAPAPTDAAWAAGNHMAKCCINRHDGAVNCLFVDGSVRKVGLKELWTLKWHRSFNTAGSWTKAGGVSPEDWPAWIRPFKEH